MNSNQMNMEGSGAYLDGYNYKCAIRGIIVMLSLCIAISVSGQSDSVLSFNRGKSLFQTNCAACHGVHKERMGPMLASVTKKRDKEWLMEFIRDSQGKIISGDEYAKFLYSKFNRQVMPSFRWLTAQNVDDILNYITAESLHQPDFSDTEPGLLTQSNGAVLKGRKIFDDQCSSCHFIEHESSYAPALGSVTKRLPREWLLPFIKKSEKVIRSGDAYANHLFSEFNHHTMVTMTFLKDEEINAVLDYIEFVSSSPHAVAGINGRKIKTASDNWVIPVPAAHKEWQRAFKIIFIIVSGLAAVVHAFVIIRFYRYLNKETPPYRSK